MASIAHFRRIIYHCHQTIGLSNTKQTMSYVVNYQGIPQKVLPTFDTSFQILLSENLLYTRLSKVEIPRLPFDKPRK